MQALQHMRADRLLAIMAHIETGAPLREVAASAGIGRAALEEWLHSDSARWDRYTRARARSATDLVHDALAITDAVAAVAKAAEKVGSVTGQVQAAALQVRARQWTAARWDRATYGQQVAPAAQVSVTAQFLSALRGRVQVVDNAGVIDASKVELLGE